jgi:hypothetical protein
MGELREIERKPDPKMIQMLEKVLESAKSGEITDIWIIARNAQGEPTGYRNVSPELRHEFLGMLEWSKHAMVDRIGITWMDLEDT